jgi:hypothetical protein
MQMKKAHKIVVENHVGEQGVYGKIILKARML